MHPDLVEFIASASLVAMLSWFVFLGLMRWVTRDFAELSSQSADSSHVDRMTRGDRAQPCASGQNENAHGSVGVLAGIRIVW